MLVGKYGPPTSSGGYAGDDPMARCRKDRSVRLFREWLFGAANAGSPARPGPPRLRLRSPHVRGQPRSQARLRRRERHALRRPSARAARRQLLTRAGPSGRSVRRLAREHLEERDEILLKYPLPDCDDRRSRPPGADPSGPSIVAIAHWNRLMGVLLYAASRRLPWSQLLRRTFAKDIEQCPKCDASGIYWTNGTTGKILECDLAGCGGGT